MIKADVAAEIDVRQLATVTGIRAYGRPPPGELVLVDAPHHIARNRALPSWRERDQKIDGNVLPLEQTSHIDHDICALRVTDPEQRTHVAGGRPCDDAR